MASPNETIAITSIGSRDHERSLRVVAIHDVPSAAVDRYQHEPGWHEWATHGGGEIRRSPHTVYRTRSRRLASERLPPGVARLHPDPDDLVWTAPVQFCAAYAYQAAALELTSHHLASYVRPENGRWVYGIGDGGMTEPRGAADTREEAIAMATAHSWSTWLRRVEEIRDARGGTLRWGLALPTPSRTELRVEAT